MKNYYATLAVLGMNAYMTTAVPLGDELAQTEAGIATSDYRSITWHIPVHLCFENESNETVQMQWYNY